MVNPVGIVLGLLVFVSLSCYGLVEAPFPPAPPDPLADYLNDSTYMYGGQMDTVDGIDTCFRCFSPGSSWLFYGRHQIYSVGDERRSPRIDTNLIVLDSVISNRYFFSKHLTGNQYPTQFAVNVWDDSVSFSGDPYDESYFRAFSPFYCTKSFANKPFRLDDGSGCYYDGETYYSSALGAVLREWHVQGYDYYLLIAVNGHPVNVGYLIREMMYKARKPVR